REGSARLRIAHDNVGFLRFTADLGSQNGCRCNYPCNSDKNRFRVPHHLPPQCRLFLQHTSTYTLDSKVDTLSEVFRSAILSSAVDVPFQSFCVSRYATSTN